MKQLLFTLLSSQICFSEWFFCDECCKAKRDYESCKIIQCSEHVLESQFNDVIFPADKRQPTQRCYDILCHEYQDNLDNACFDFQN